MVRVDLNFIKGDTYSRGFTIENCKFNITQIYFTVKEKPSDKNYVIQKRLNAGITQDANQDNRYVLVISPEDTDNLKTNTNYVFDIEITSAVIKKTIVGGYFKLEDWDITCEANEVA